MQVNQRREIAPEYARAREKTKSERKALRSMASWAMELLEASGIPFAIFNDGLHVKIGADIDYWPTSGVWIDHAERYNRFGIKPLIVWCKAIHGLGREVAL